jgi:hypothetical protein
VDVPGGVVVVGKGVITGGVLDDSGMTLLGCEVLVSGRIVVGCGRMLGALDVLGGLED